MTPLLKPTFLGAITSYLLFSFGGLFLGSVAGSTVGNYFVQRNEPRDPQARHRIQAAFRMSRAERLRKEADWLDSQGTASNKLMRSESGNRGR